MNIPLALQITGKTAILLFALVLLAACNFPIEPLADAPSTNTPSPIVTFTPLSPVEVNATETPQPVEPTDPPVTASATSNLTERPTQASSPKAPTAEVELLEDSTALVLQNAFCRGGPGTNYEPVTAYEAGSHLKINGRNAGTSWWRVQVGDTQASCYISAILLKVDGDLVSVPEVPDPPTPIPTSTPTPKPTRIPPTSTPVPPTSAPTATITPPTVIPPRKPPN